MLTWLLAWTRLIAEEPDAVDVANAAVARVAARRKRLTGHALRAAARDEAARMLARGVAAAPELDTAGSRMLVAGDRTVPSAAFTPPADADGSDIETTPDDRPTYPLTPAERLALALKDLAPYERLACVVAVLDGASTAEVAALLGVTHARAAAILDRAYPRLAAVTGEAERPDFHTIAGDEVAVVVR